VRRPRTVAPAACYAARVRGAAAGLLVVCVGACSGSAPRADSRLDLVSPHARDASLARAHVWREPALPLERIDLSINPPGPFRDTDDVTCAFLTEPVGGTTPKFHCRTSGGIDIKVKYGAGNPELPASTAASRLMLALGFSVDPVFRVHSVRCAGCPADPFTALQCVDNGGARERCLAGAQNDRAVAFDAVTIERQIEGRVIESAPDQGWSWFELDRIDPRVGGSSRAEVDALRLMAVLLAHWDNKGANQRLICPAGAELRDGVCAAPLAMLQDLGATFGPLKLDLPNWQHTHLWVDARSCTATMKALPYDGGTFGEHAISEEGRRLALRLLRRLSAAQIRGLFIGSGVTELDQVVAAARDPDAWTRAFLDKVAAIETAGPCPTVTR
jgi:hypothetical protein